MDEYHKFKNAVFLIPSFVYIIGVGGAIAMVQLIMIYFKTGKGLLGGGVDTPTVVYSIIIAIILLLSVVVPLIAYSKRKKNFLVSVAHESINIQEKVFRSAQCFQLNNIESLKLYVCADEKRSSMRIQLKSGQVVLLQFMYVLIAQKPFKIFMKEQCNIEVLDW